MRLSLVLFLSSVLALVPLHTHAEEAPAPDSQHAKDPCEKKRLMRATWLRNRADMVQMGICYFQRSIAQHKKEIAAEYALAKYSGGGIVDKAKIYDEQQSIRAALRVISEINEIKNAIAKFKERPLPCSAEPLQKTLACLFLTEEQKPKYCTSEPWITFAETLDAFTDVMADVETTDECPSEPPPFAN